MNVNKIIGFVSISGIGFLLDLAIFMTLTSLGAPIFWSNLIAGICGMTLVYTASWHKIFTPSDNSFIRKLFVYIGYGLCLLTFSSWLVTELTVYLTHLVALLPFVLPPVLIRLAAKAIVTVFTLICNYGFSTYLVEQLSLKPSTRGR